ncbi:FkbM family methyltransferase [Aquimarina mytili]|uniref:FkbM family methyltransferase n=1 Tax=Aquimarina mytili TaxID=874423 RepID=A0A937D8C5_9FLAO|nr:FkbM family methyltransferase [Aquimarina mytili]MBL0682557.1 FkbM family methyltransferase [Aquimarina mytili]
MKTKILRKISGISNLKRNFSFFDSIKISNALKKEKENITLSDNSQIHLRKNTKDHETFDEVFIDNIYNLPLPIAPKTIIDAGANIGLASLFFKMKYPDSAIALIEIDSGNLEMIRKNLKGYTNITILNKGLYNKHSYFKIFDPFNATNSFVIKESTQDDYDIESITIDQIIDDHSWDTIDILKIDIEGAEKNLFESNYQHWLPKVNVLMIETHDRMVPKCSITVMKALDEYDFGLYTTTNGGTLVYYNSKFLQ